MIRPAFFDDVRKIALRDPLAEFLGAAEGGVIEYGYLDAVKLAGHSCPTVAAAYLMTLKALAHLYGDELPERGAVRVLFRDDMTSGVTGVMGNVAGLLTGAAGPGGFKGIGGRFDRRSLLVFGAGIESDVRFERVDGGGGVDAAFRAEIVPPAPEMRALMPKVLSGGAAPEEQREFGRLWQERVKRILIDHADDPALVILG